MPLPLHVPKSLNELVDLCKRGAPREIPQKNWPIPVVAVLVTPDDKVDMLTLHMEGPGYRTIEDMIDPFSVLVTSARPKMLVVLMGYGCRTLTSSDEYNLALFKALMNDQEEVSKLELHIQILGTDGENHEEWLAPLTVNPDPVDPSASTFHMGEWQSELAAGHLNLVHECMRALKQVLAKDAIDN